MPAALSIPKATTPRMGICPAQTDAEASRAALRVLAKKVATITHDVAATEAMNASYEHTRSQEDIDEGHALHDREIDAALARDALPPGVTSRIQYADGHTLAMVSGWRAPMSDADRSWTFLAARVDCTWRDPEIAGEVVTVDDRETPAGEMLLRAYESVEQCGATTTLFRLRGAKAEPVARYEHVRDVDFCGNGVDEERMKLELDGDRVLTTIRALEREDGSHPWTTKWELVWNGERYVTSK